MSVPTKSRTTVFPRYGRRFYRSWPLFAEYETVAGRAVGDLFAVDRSFNVPISDNHRTFTVHGITFGVATNSGRIHRSNASVTGVNAIAEYEIVADRAVGVLLRLVWAFESEIADDGTFTVDLGPVSIRFTTRGEPS